MIKMFIIIDKKAIDNKVPNLAVKTVKFSKKELIRYAYYYLIGSSEYYDIRLGREKKKFQDEFQRTLDIMIKCDESEYRFEYIYKDIHIDWIIYQKMIL